MAQVLGKYVSAIVFLVAITAFASAHAGETKGLPLNGELGVAPQWGCGWINLASPVDLSKGDVLQIQVGGTAQKVLVRCLVKTQSPDSTEGVIGDAVVVPKSRIIKVKLTSPRSNVIQISVHGGAKPWGIYELGQSNGAATLMSATLIRG